MIYSPNLHLLDNVHLALAGPVYFVRRITCGGRGLQAWRVRNNRAREDKQRQQRENDKDIQIPGGCDRLHCELVKSLQQQWPLVASYPVPPDLLPLSTSVAFTLGCSTVHVSIQRELTVPAIDHLLKSAINILLMH